MKLVRSLLLVPVLLVLSAQCALAYVDPGVTGMLFQMGYVAFYGALAVLAAFFRPIKIFSLTVKQKLFGGKRTVPEVVSEIDKGDDEDVELDPKIEEVEEVEELEEAEVASE